MSTYEENWEQVALVTAEAVFGVGIPSWGKARKESLPSALGPEGSQGEKSIEEAAD